MVSDNTSDLNIGTVLSGDGHTVTTVTNDFSGGNNTVLQGPFGPFSAVFWSATGTQYGSNHSAATFTNLINYVIGGGRVFVTGYDSIASPLDANLIAFLGGTSSVDFGGNQNSGTITGSNSLSTGVVDIIGVDPTGNFSDWDTLTGLNSDTACVSARSGVSGGCAWSLRTLGLGEIAYISNGEYFTAGNGGLHPSWEDTSAGGNGAFNAAIRNFAANSVAVPEPTSIILLGLGLLGLSYRKRK